MVRPLIILLFISTTAFAEDAGSSRVQEWWDNTYQQQIAPEQRQQVYDEELEKCSEKLNKYARKVDENPNSIYYNYKLDYWLKRCSP